MADETLQEVKIKLLGEIEVNKGSVYKTGKIVGMELKDGIETVIQSTDIASAIRKSDFSRMKTAISTKVADTMIKEQIAQIKAVREEMMGVTQEKTWNNSFAGLNSAVERVSAFMSELKGSAGTHLLTASIKSLASAFGSLKNKVKETLKPIHNFFSAIKRIAIYRAIRWALKQITQGFNEGIQNAYQWAVVTGNQFARSMDMMATSALYLKNSLGAMVMPLVNYLAPILDILTDKFVELINVVNRFIATITGASSWTKALKYPAEYMDSMAGSAKELKNQLLSFDDLNVLNANKGSGSASALDYSNMFKQMELAGESVNFTKSLMEAIKNSDWDALEELLDEHINGLIERIDAKGIAKSLGEKLNKAIRLVHTLLKAIDFHQIGVKIGEFISNLKLDWNTIAQSWIRWATNIADVLLGVIHGINWANVGKALGEFVKGMFNGISDWLKEVNWQQVGADITRAFLDLIGSIDWNGVFRSFYSGLWGILQAVWNGISGAWRTLIRLFTGDLSLNDIINGVHHSGMSYYEGVHISIGGNEHSTGGGRGFANGGFPTQGTIFYAGESGAEFVGQIGGRTGVYNADQMANSLASANEVVVNTLVSVGNAVVGAINRKDTSVNITDIRRALQTSNMRYGV